MKVYAERGILSNYNSDQIIFFFDDWDFTSDINDANIIIGSEDRVMTNDIKVYEDLDKDKTLVIMYMGANHNAYSPSFFRELHVNLKDIRRVHPKLLIAHTNVIDIDLKYIPFDIMFNRHKLYCTEYNLHREKINIMDSIWMKGIPEIAYSLNIINKKFESTNKHFLCPLNLLSVSKIGKEYESCKIFLNDFFDKSDIKNKTYLSDKKNNIFLQPNGWDGVSSFVGGSWIPVGDVFYDTSYVSIAIETITHNEEGDDIFSLCEKSFNHLIKGNFLLPFSSKHTIKRCKEIYGFKFPNWIDYSYDDVQDFEMRFQGFLNSIKKISEIPINELHQLYLNDITILEHNRNVFSNRPYDNLLPKIKESIELLGW